MDVIRQERSVDAANVVVTGGSNSDMVLEHPLAEGDSEGMLQLNGECFSFRLKLPGAKNNQFPHQFHLTSKRDLVHRLESIVVIQMFAAKLILLDQFYRLTQNELLRPILFSFFS